MAAQYSPQRRLPGTGFEGQYTDAESLPRQLRDRQGPRQVVALSKIDTDALELREHRFGLDALGNRRDAEGPADLDDRLDHAAIHRVVGDMTDELPVDLEEIDRQRLQIHEGRQPGAEVVQRELAAARFQLAHEVGDAGEAGHRRRLGDLEAQGGGDRGVAHALQDELDEGLLVEGRAREIDREQRRRLLAQAPRLQQLDRLLHDPPVDDRHDVIALGRRDELTRWHERSVIVPQAHRELMEARRGCGSDRHDGLEEQLQAVFLHGARNARNPTHLAMAVGDAVRLVYVNAIAALVLRGIAGDIRRAHHARDALGLRVDMHDTDAGPDRQRARSPHEPVVADGLAHAIGDARGLFRSAAFQQHAELIAAQARDGVGDAHSGLQQTGDVAQQTVAGLVAARVVHHFELVEIDVQQSVAALAALRAQHRRVQAVVELTAVDQAGERVVARLIGQRPFQAPFLGDIVKHDDRADDPALAVADRSGGFLDRHFLTGARDEHRVVGGGAALAATQHAQQRIVDRLARDLVDEIQDLADRAAARLLQAPGRQALGDRIDVFDAPLGIGADDGVANRLERHLRPLLLGEHRLLGALALRDVRNRTLVAHDAVFSVTHCARVLQNHDLLPVAPAHTEFCVAYLTFGLYLPH